MKNGTQTDGMGRVGRVQFSRGQIHIDRFVKVERVALCLSGGLSDVLPTEARRTSLKKEKDLETQLARETTKVFGVPVRISPPVNGQRNLYPT